MRGDTVVVPASDQQRDWYERELTHRNPDLIISFRVPLAHDVSPEACLAAVTRLTERHGALRTGFAVHDGVVVQVVHDEVRDFFWSEDLRDLPEAERWARYADVVERERLTEFDLGRAPLLRAGLVRMAPGVAVISLTMHHMITDGWTNQLIRKELAVLLAAEVAGEPAKLPPAMQCAEWSEAERQWSTGPQAATQLAYWRGALADVRPLSVPATVTTGPADTFEHAELRVTGSAAVHEQLAAAARRLRTTVPMLAMTVYLKLLSTTTGRDDVATMTMVTGRKLPGYHTVVGSLTNVLTIHAEGAAERGVPELVPQVMDRLIAAYRHERLFVTRVWDQVQLDAGDIDSLFVFDVFAEPQTHFGPYPLAPVPEEAARTFRRRDKWWENWKVRYLDAPTGPTVTVEYNANRYDEGFARSFATQYLDLLRTL